MGRVDRSRCGRPEAGGGEVTVVVVCRSHPAVAMVRVPLLGFSAPIKYAALTETDIQPVADSYVEKELSVYAFWAGGRIYRRRQRWIVTVAGVDAAEVGNFNGKIVTCGIFASWGCDPPAQGPFPSSDTGRAVCKVKTGDTAGNMCNRTVKG